MGVLPRQRSEPKLRKAGRAVNEQTKLLIYFSNDMGLKDKSI